MALTDQPPLSRSYPANVVLVILTLFPGLINTSAIGLIAPVIGSDLGVAADAAAVIPLMSDAALAFGCLLAAELTRRVESRGLYFWLLGTSLLTSLASALAPSFDVLLAAHVLHGLVAGMLFIVTLPPLLTNFGSGKISSTAMVIVPALFGAATLGPLVGGLTATPVLWRSIFAAEVLAAMVTFFLARMTLQRRPPQASDQPIDWAALILSGLGSLLVYIGVGALAGNAWTDVSASGPVAAGILMYVALIIVEARAPRPLVPVRKLVTSLALIGTIATVIGSATFSALTQCLMLTLLRVDALTPRVTGLTFWPEFLTAIAAGYVFGQLVKTKWVATTGAIGLGFIAVAASLAHLVSPVSAAHVSWLSVISGFGAGLSVSPGLFLIALSFERSLVARAVALLNLFRLTGGFISSPGVEHTIGSRAVTHFATAHPEIPFSRVETMIRAFITGRQQSFDVPKPWLQAALADGISDAYAIVIALCVAGIAAIIALFVIAHLRLQAPNLRRFDNGEPALEAVVLA